MRELWIMWKENARDAWNHTGAIQAMLYNTNRKKGAPAKKPDDFNPITLREKGNFQPLTEGEGRKILQLPRQSSPLE